MAVDGTFETCRRPLRMSVCRGRPEVTSPWSNDAIDPTETLGISGRALAVVRSETDKPQRVQPPRLFGAGG
jgi:hypothetical protein